MIGNDKMAKEAADKLKQTLAGLPDKFKSLGPEFQADMNKLTQIALSNAKMITKEGVDLEGLRRNSEKAEEIHNKMKNTKYGVHTNK